MHPLLAEAFPSYFGMWLCAAVGGFVLGVVLATHAGFPRVRAGLALASAVLFILLGSKLLYLFEARFFPTDDYVPEELRGTLHGFRIPGGIIALALSTVPVCRVLGLPWRRFGDLLIPLAAAGLVAVRLGCFLNGCCFGRVSATPWALEFPPGSWVYWYHRSKHWVPAAAPTSLPVHPLQLYFLLASAATCLYLLWRSRDAEPGSQQLLFYTLFFASTALLEPIRENSLTLNNWLVPVAATLSVTFLLRERLRAAYSDRVVGAR